MTKLKIFAFILLFSGCSQYTTRLHLKKIRRQLENCVWENSYEDNGVIKKGYFVFKEFGYYKNKLTCFAEYDGNPTNFLGNSFEYSNGKIIKCFTRVQDCSEVRFVKDTIFVYYKTEEGQDAITKYVKHK